MRDRGGDIRGRVPQTNWEDLCICTNGEQRGCKRQDPAPIGGGAFGEYDDGLVWVLFQ